MLSSILVVAIAIAAQGELKPVPAPSATPAASPGPSANVARTPPLPAVPPGEIHGEVLRPDGKPAARARVGFFAIPGPGLIVPAPVVITADEQGAFRFETQGVKEFYLLAHLPNFAPAHIPRLAGGKRVKMKLLTGATVTGDVVDAATSKPIAGAVLETAELYAAPFADVDPDFSIARAKTDEAGRFTIPGVSADGRPMVRVNARGYASETSSVTSNAQLKFRLSPGRDLPGVVNDMSGRPVAKATVTLRGPSAGLSARSAPDGRFEVRGLRNGSYDVTVVAAGFAPFTRSGVAEDVLSLRVSLQKQSIVTGRIVDEEGKPVKGMARLRSHDGVQVTGQFGREAMAPVTADGRFTLKTLIPGTNVIQIAGMGYPPISKTIEIAQAGETLDLGDVVLESGFAILGRVLDKEGRPIVAARIQVNPPRTTDPVEPLWAESDSEGRFTARGLKSETHDVLVNASGFAMLESKLAPSLDEQVLVMKPSVKITGRIVDPELAPVTRAMVWIQKADDRRNARSGQTAADGRFSIEIAEPGEVTVNTSAEFFERSFRNVVVAGDTDLGDLMLSRGLRLRGVVVDSKGAPIEGARVENQSAQQFPRTTAVTDGKGAFEMRGASPGRVRLVASHRDYSPAQIMVDATDESGRDPDPVRLTLTKGGRIEGIVQMRDGTPVPQARLQLMRTGSASRPQPSNASMENAVTGADGTFAFERLYPETLQVMLMAGQAGRYTNVTSVEARVTEGETARVALTLRSTVVRGAVRRNGLPADGLHVKVFGDFNITSSGQGNQGSLNAQIPWTAATTDAQGQFALQVVGPLKGRVQVEDGRGSSLFWKPIEVPDVEEFPLDLEFGGARASGRVLDKSTGQGIAQARVTARKMESSQAGVISQSRVTGPGGEFVFEVEPGAYRVSVTAPNYAGASPSVTVSPGESSLEDISLDRGGTFLGRAVLPNGRPAVDAQVRAMGGETFISAMSGPDGSFALRGLPSGPFSVTATDSTDHIGVVRVEALTEDVVEVRLALAAKISATVVASQDLLTRTTVAVSTVNGAPYTGTIAVRPDARGVALLTAPPGTLTVVARSGTYEGLATIQVQPGESTSVIVEMKPRAVPPKQ